MPIEIDHYYTQRDQQTVSAPDTPARSSGKTHILSLRTLGKKSSPLHREIFGSDDECESPPDNQAQQFLDSLDLDENSLSIPFPRPRKIAGTRRAVSAQTNQRLKDQSGWKVGALANPACADSPSLPPIPALPVPQVFQSITAMPHLGGRSFEELRAECYAQSYIATGAPPPPSTPLGIFQSEQCIPPTFRSSVVVDPPLDSTLHPMDVEMVDEIY